MDYFNVVPPRFQNCSDIFIIHKDEKYANCVITNGEDPCYLLKELHRAKEFRTYFLAIIPIVFSAIAFCLNIAYLAIQIRCYISDKDNYRKRYLFLMSRSVSSIFANLLLYVVVIVWKSEGFFYTTAMIFIVVGSLNFLSVTGSYIGLTLLLYLSIVRREWYRCVLTVNQCIIAVAVMWLLCAISSVLVGLWGATLFYPESAPVSCHFDSCQQPLAIVIVVGLSLCYASVLGLYLLMMIRLHRIFNNPMFIKTKSAERGMKAIKRLGFNMFTFAVCSIPILVVCIVALANLRDLSQLGEGKKTPCKTYLYSPLFVEVETLASIAAIVWLFAMIVDPIINVLADEKMMKILKNGVNRVRNSVRRVRTTKKTDDDSSES